MKPGIRKTLKKNKLIICRQTNATQFSTEIEVLNTINYNIYCVCTYKIPSPRRAVRRTVPGRVPLPNRDRIVFWCAGVW